MRIDGHGVRDYLRLSAPYLGILVAIWTLRLLIHAAGAPMWAVRLLSVTATVQICLVLLVLQVHLRRFGGYASVLVFSFILNGWAQLLIVAAVAFTWLTGWSNVFSRPGFLLPGGQSDLGQHIYGQLTLILGILTVISALTGCLFLFLLRRVLPEGR